MEKRGDQLVIEGDIVLGSETELADKGSAKGLTDVNARLWKKATVPSSWLTISLTGRR